MSVKKNTVYNMIKTLSAAVFPIITFPYISRTLLAENVGKLNFSNSVVSYFALMAELGISVYAVRECAKVRDDKQKLEKTASQLFSIRLLTTLIAYAALLVTLCLASNLESYRSLILLQSSTILFGTLGADWINTAFEDFRYVTLRTVAFQLLSLVLMFLFVHRPEDYMVYALISVISSSAANVVNILYRRKYCKISIRCDLELKRHLPPILWMFSTQLSQTVYCNSDMTMLGLLRGDMEVGLYSTAVKVYRLVNICVASISFVLMPKMSNCFAKRDYASANELFHKSFNYITVLGLPCVAGLMLTADDVIAAIGGQEFLGAIPALRILAVAMALSFGGGLVGNIVNIPAQREKVCLVAAVSAALVNVILNIFLLPQYGFCAAAWTTVAAEAVALVISVRYMEPHIKVTRIRDTIQAPVIGTVLMLCVAVLVRSCVKNLYVRLILTVFAGAGCYFSVLLLLKHEFTVAMITPVINKLKGMRKKI